MSKHTPVSWFVDIEGNRILANDDRATIICHMSATVKNPDVMAAANKISAAPDLLEALEAAAEALEAAEFFEKAAMARAAIAKAKGESA